MVPPVISILSETGVLEYQINLSLSIISLLFHVCICINIGFSYQTKLFIKLNGIDLTPSSFRQTPSS